MTKDQKRLQAFFKILADESKYKIILHLMNGEECVCVIAEKLGMEQSLVSHHLNTLRSAKLIQDRKVGIWVHCSLNKRAFEDLGNLYQKTLSSKSISDKSCNTHEICQNKHMNKKFIIYDPPMCCSSGICGPSPDQTLIEFEDTLAQIKKLGAEVKRYIITQSPEKFKENSQVIKLIQEKQLTVLPITTLNGTIVKTVSYPTLEEFRKFIKEK